MGKIGNYIEKNFLFTDGCIVTEHGVTKASSYLPELAGKLAFRFVEGMDPSRLIQRDRRFDLQPETYRRIGIACMGLVGAVVSNRYGGDLADGAIHMLDSLNDSLMQSVATNLSELPWQL